MVILINPIYLAIKLNTHTHTHTLVSTNIMQDFTQAALSLISIIVILMNLINPCNEVDYDE